MPEDEQAENRPKPASMVERIRPYMWRPGQSGNPRGRPKGATTDPLLKAKRLARESLTEALAVCVAIMRGETDPEVRIKAARFVKDLADEASGLKGYPNDGGSEPAHRQEVDVTPLIRQLSSEALARIVGGNPPELAPACPVGGDADPRPAVETSTPPGGTGEESLCPEGNERSEPENEAVTPDPQKGTL